MEESDYLPVEVHLTHESFNLIKHNWDSFVNDLTYIHSLFDLVPVPVINSRGNEGEEDHVHVCISQMVDEHLTDHKDYMKQVRYCLMNYGLQTFYFYTDDNISSDADDDSEEYKDSFDELDLL